MPSQEELPIISWARVDGNDPSLKEVSIGNDTDDTSEDSDRFDWSEMIDALKRNTHVSTVIVYIDRLTMSELIMVGFMLRSSRVIKTLKLRKCNSREKVKALFTLFHEMRNLTFTELCLDADFEWNDAFEANDVVSEIKRFLGEYKHLKKFRFNSAQHTTSPVWEGLKHSSVTDLQLGYLHLEDMLPCFVNLIRKDCFRTLGMWFFDDNALKLLSVAVQGSNMLRNLDLGFFDSVTSSVLSTFLTDDLRTLPNLSSLVIHLGSHTVPRTLRSLATAVCRSRAIKRLGVYSGRMSPDCLSALRPVLSHLNELHMALAPVNDDEEDQEGMDSVTPEILYDTLKNAPLSKLTMSFLALPFNSFPGLVRAVPTMKRLCSLTILDDVGVTVDNTMIDVTLDMIQTSETLSTFECKYSDDVPEKAKTEIAFYLKCNKVQPEHFVEHAPLSLWPQALAKVQKYRKPTSLDMFYFLLHHRCDVLVPPGNSQKKLKANEDIEHV